MIEDIMLSWAVKKALDIIYDTLLGNYDITNNKTIFITQELGFSWSKAQHNKIVLIPLEKTKKEIGGENIVIDIANEIEANEYLINEIRGRLESHLDSYIDHSLDSN